MLLLLLLLVRFCQEYLLLKGEESVVAWEGMFPMLPSALRDGTLIGFPVLLGSCLWCQLCPCLAAAVGAVAVLKRSSRRDVGLKQK